MIPVNPYELSYDHAVCCGIPMIFTDLRIKKDMLPDDLFSYDVRHSEEGDVCSIEKRVLINFYGTLISKKPIEKIEDLHGDVDIFNDECDENFYFDGGSLTLKEFIDLEEEPDEQLVES